MLKRSNKLPKWAVYEMGESTWIHIVPLDDLIEHVFELDCSCGPRLDIENNLCIHCSLDRRECFEDGNS